MKPWVASSSLSVATTFILVKDVVAVLIAFAVPGLHEDGVHDQI